MLLGIAEQPHTSRSRWRFRSKDVQGDEAVEARDTRSSWAPHPRARSWKYFSRLLPSNANRNILSWLVATKDGEFHPG